MNSVEIAHAIRRDPYASRLFDGVFSIDEFPMNFTGVFVLNTSPSYIPYGHWVALYGNEFFCSYGTNPQLYGLPMIPYNHTQLQSVGSDVCGKYVITYLQLRCRGYTMEDMLTCFTDDPLLNDRIVTTYDTS